MAYQELGLICRYEFDAGVAMTVGDPVRYSFIEVEIRRVTSSEGCCCADMVRVVYQSVFKPLCHAFDFLCPSLHSPAKEKY